MILELVLEAEKSTIQNISSNFKSTATKKVNLRKTFVLLLRLLFNWNQLWKKTFLPPNFPQLLWKWLRSRLHTHTHTHTHSHSHIFSPYRIRKKFKVKFVLAEFFSHLLHLSEIQRNSLIGWLRITKVGFLDMSQIIPYYNSVLS